MTEDQFEEFQAVDFESISALIPGSRDGDPQAQAQLLKQMQDYLELMAVKYMDKSLQQKIGPSDIVQQTMTQVLQNFDDFRGETAPEFRAWLKAIVVNEMNNMRRTFRAQKRDVGREKRLDGPLSTASTGFSPADTQLTPSSEAMAAEQVAKFHEVLGQLADDYAQVIRLRSIEKLSFREIAEKMDRSHDSVTKLWYRAVLKLEEKLKENDDFNSQF